MTIHGRKTVKSKTNVGDIAKSYCAVMEDEKSEKALIVNCIVLTKNPEFYINDFSLLKIYKGHYLTSKWFSIKLSTLNIVNDWIKTL